LNVFFEGSSILPCVIFRTIGSLSATDVFVHIMCINMSKMEESCQHHY
jgi:hypothetical protein